MQPQIPQSHGADVDYKSPENPESKVQRDRSAGAGGDSNKENRHVGTGTPKEGGNRTNTITRVSRERKETNKEIIHSRIDNLKERETTIKNKNGLKTLNIITINPDSLKNNDNLNEIVARMNKKLIHVACIQETHVRQNTDRWVENYKFFNAAATKLTQKSNNREGGECYVGGVGILIEQKLVEHVICVCREGNRLIRVTLDNQSVKGSIPITILCTYAPHSGHSAKDRQDHWNAVGKWLADIPERHFLMWGTDANGQVASSGDGDAIGPYTNAKGNEDENGKALRKLCRDRDLRPMNTWKMEGGGGGENREGDYTTWISPNGKVKRQTDYIIVRKRFQNSVNACRKIKGMER